MTCEPNSHKDDRALMVMVMTNATASTAVDAGSAEHALVVVSVGWHFGSAYQAAATNKQKHDEEKQRSTVRRIVAVVVIVIVISVPKHLPESTAASVHETPNEPSLQQFRHLCTEI